MPASPSDHRHTVIAAALRETRMFADLPSSDIDAIASGCVIQKLAKDQSLFREGEKADGFYVLQSGAIKVYRLTPDGREQIICLFRGPDTFSEVALGTAECYPANANALETSQVILVKTAHMRELIQRRPELSLRMLASMSLHLKHLVQTVQDLKGRQVEHRLAAWILENAADQDGFEMPFSKKVLAGHLGVTSETLSRALARFRKLGLIDATGTSIRVQDRPALIAQLD